MSLPAISYSQTNTNIEWSITGARTRHQDGRDVVVQLDWVMMGTRLDSINRPVSELKSGTVVLDYDPDNFVDYNNLTQSRLANWAQAHLGLDRINQLRSELLVKLDSHFLTAQAIPA
jgi:hypothetical protein